MELISKYQATVLESHLRQKLRSYYKRSVLHEQKVVCLKKTLPMLFLIEWIEMPVMPDISAH